MLSLKSVWLGEVAVGPEHIFASKDLSKVSRRCVLYGRNAAIEASMSESYFVTHPLSNDARSGNRRHKYNEIVKLERYQSERAEGL